MLSKSSTTEMTIEHHFRQLHSQQKWKTELVVMVVAAGQTPSKSGTATCSLVSKYRLLETTPPTQPSFALVELGCFSITVTRRFDDIAGKTRHAQG